MKRILVCLVPWMALTTVAHGQSRNADVFYTYYDDSPTHGYRVGDECFIPIEEVVRWGWHIEARGDNAKIDAEGIDFTIPVRTVASRVSVPIRAAIAKLGDSSEWINSTDTLQIVGELNAIRIDSGRIRVSGPLQFKPKAFVLTDPSRLVMDFVGVKIGKKTLQNTEGGVRVSQYKPNVVRVVMQTPSIPDITQISTQPTKATELEISIGPVAEEKPITSDPKNPPPPPIQPVSPTPAGTQVKPVTKETKSDGEIVDGTSQTDPKGAILPLALEKEDDRSALLTLKFGNGISPQAQIQKPTPKVLQITLPGIYMDLAPDFKLDTASIESVNSQRTPQGTLLTFNLNRPIGAEVYTDGHTVNIQLYKPNVGDGKLSGRVIVVDGGHGGWDNGASSAGLHEKDFNLILAKLLSERLSEEGATVIMTRKTDVFIPLTTRSDIANRSHADMFLSCHVNDTGGSGNTSGGITFHHKGNMISKVLAECIQQEIAAVSGIPNMGVWSDGKIYSQGGFSVLRNIKMVGVLIEFGFLNNEHDRKRMSTSQFQDAVTRAVVKGLKVYLGDAKAK